jgi:hypothetical protein
MSQLRAPSARRAKIMRAAREAQRLWMSATLVALLLSASAPMRAGADPSACPAAGTSHATIASIDERLEITLKDGRTLRLAGLEPPHPTPDRPDFDMTARDALRAHGVDIAFVALSQRPDRWGRIPAFVFFGQPGEPTISAGQFLLAGGFARFMPEPEAAPMLAPFPCGRNRRPRRQTRPLKRPVLCDPRAHGSRRLRRAGGNQRHRRRPAPRRR